MIAEAPSHTSLELKRWLRGFVRGLTKNKAVPVGLVVLLAIVTAAAFAPLLAPVDPNETDVVRRLVSPGEFDNLLGTDNLGRDILSRIIYGARVSLIVSVLGVLSSGLFGIVIGAISGYYGGKLDDVGNWIMNVQLTIPFILLAIALVTIFGPGLRNMIIVLAVTQWVIYARVIRGSVLAVKEADYVEAARAIGGSQARILIRHILTNSLAPLIVVATFQLARLVLYEASLSFLGLGVPSNTPSWGSMISDGRAYLATAWWVSTLPGVAIMLFVLSVNILGDWLRDELDPRLRNTM